MLKRLFGFDPQTTTVRTELLAGITTFLTMSYILAVNPAMFSELDGISAGASFTATALTAIVGSLIMALCGKLPLGLAPGMGLNAFFVYTVCMGMGHTWQFALTAVFIEGLLFIVLTLTNLREAIVNAIPPTLRSAIGAGIGLFIAFIGLQNAGIIVGDKVTLITLGNITSGTALLAIVGMVITGWLVIRNVTGGLLIGILITTLIGLPFGITKFGGIVSAPHSIAPIFMQFEWEHIFSLDMLMVVFTFLFIDLFDAIGTLVGVCTKADMLEADGRIPRIRQAFMADSVATALGACFGTSTATIYVESASGVLQGGRSGLTAFVIACCFTVALLFSPLFLSIPSAATAPVLVIVGLFMMSPIKSIDFDNYSEALPAFITVIVMPMAYSISDGILLGMISYVVLNTLCGNHKRITPTMYILAVLFILKYIFM